MIDEQRQAKDNHICLHIDAQSHMFYPSFVSQARDYPLSKYKCHVWVIYDLLNRAATTYLLDEVPLLYHVFISILYLYVHIYNFCSYVIIIIISLLKLMIFTNYKYLHRF
jgi:hypothetical protein